MQHHDATPPPAPATLEVLNGKIDILIGKVEVGIKIGERTENEVVRLRDDREAMKSSVQRIQNDYIALRKVQGFGARFAMVAIAAMLAAMLASATTLACAYHFAPPLASPSATH